MSIALREGFANLPLKDNLEDLLVRFVINCPSEDLSSIERVFFQIEEAQWFYSDFIRTLNHSLPPLKMKGFSKQIIDICPAIWKWGDPSDALARFGKYKSTIPVRGVALFNESLSKMLLVQGTESSSWSFPRGKINKEEDDGVCALRECKEETGFDAGKLLDEHEYVERTIRGKNYKIFLVKNVPEDFEFRPLVRNEINEIKWKNWKKVMKECRNGSNAYYLVNSMCKPIDRWVNKQKGINDEETLKKYAESQLKSLLGIGESIKHFSDAKRQIDAGREILDLLHKQSTNDQENGTTNNGLPEIFQKLLSPVDQPQQQQQQQQQQEFFNPGMAQVPNLPHSMQQQTNFPLQCFVPFYGIPVFPTFPQQNLMHHPVPQSFPSQPPIPPASVPNPNTFSKPVFNNTENNPLFTLLQRKASSNQETAKNSQGRELLGILNKEADSTDEKNSKELLVLLNKKEKTNEPVPLKGPEISNKDNSIFSKLYGQGTEVEDHKQNNVLLSLLKKPASAPATEPVESSNELLSILKKQSSVESNASNGEDSGNGNQLLSMLQGPPKDTSSTGSNELLGLLKGKPSHAQNDGSNELMSILHQQRPATPASGNNELLSILRQQPQPGIPISKPESLESIERSAPTLTSNAGGNELLSILNGGGMNSQQNGGSDELLSILQKPKEKPKNDLLSILHGGL
ncbi:decapping enzyme complex catalytic subunit [Saccharomycopsis crataegensis]|uniref:Decapping enzyme complex catalytic subunit n=1 Tax=Saccharomycopsis crataegensis TaxID=43959 RepID=A0AAV5QPF8_9ASCO|nr:decapping enzyme complex catalytic subunit [Saccharomycopsis crataegensis]